MIDLPFARPRRLKDCPGASPMRWHVAVFSACADKSVRDGLIPDDFEMNLGYASSAGLRVAEHGCVEVHPNGDLDMTLDVNQSPRDFAWCCLHENAEVAYQLRHPEVRFQQMTARAAWQRCVQEAHALAVVYADLAILAPSIQGAIRWAETEISAVSN